MKWRLWPFGRRRFTEPDPDLAHAKRLNDDRDTRLGMLDAELFVISGGQAPEPYRGLDRRKEPRTT